MKRIFGFALIISLAAGLCACAQETSTLSRITLNPPTIDPLYTPGPNSTRTPIPSCAMELNALQDGSAWRLFTTADGLQSDFVSDVLVGPDQSVWFITSAGLSRLQGETWTTYPEIHAHAAVHHSAYAFTVQGNLWLADQDGALFLVTGNSVQPIPLDNGNLEDWVTALAVTPDGMLWVGTQNNGLFRYDGSQWIFADVFAGETGKHITALTVTDIGVLFVGTEDGQILKLTGDQWEIVEIGEGPLNYRSIEQFVEAPDGTIWIGASCRVVHYSEENGILAQFYTLKTEGCDGSTNLTIAPDGSAWFATFMTGIYHATDVNDSRISESAQPPEYINFSSQDGLFTSQGSGFAIDPNGGVWAGFQGGGIAYFDGESWRLNRLYSSCGDVRDVAKGPDGSIWFATDGGVLKYQGN